MKITKLRLLGFKSFVEPTELLIEPGLTGVLGPNGCGKSNLLEALRWVMGETSYKSMRGSTMEDVIFSGTDKRPQRNMAEVTMFLDNIERKAPAEYNNNDVIEVTRRIEREMGSAYRINGKEARARDIKILFEDAATGARSPALVRQGQIGQIVNAKPEQRRRILEDAAGIAGLHSRRHEAELRLRQAETNMERLRDVLGQLNSQVESLKRQARQAKRYKELSGEIRKTQAIAFHLGWLDVQQQVTDEESGLATAMRELGLATKAESTALREEVERNECLQPLRDDEAVRGAVLHRIKVEQETFEKEAQRTAQREREQSARMEQIDRDLAREADLIKEAKEALERINHEAKSLDEEAKLSVDFAAKTATELSTIETKLERAEMLLAELNTRVADDRAQRKSLDGSKTEREGQVDRLERQLTGLAAQAREIAARAPDIASVTAAQEAGQNLSRQLGEIEVQALAADEEVQNATSEAQTRRETSTKANLVARSLMTEIETLQKLLRPTGSSDHPPVADQLKVTAGYEVALGAALGDDLDAPAFDADETASSDTAPVHWRTIATAGDGDLPSEAEPLANYVTGAVELLRRLAQVGIVSRSDGERLQPKLHAGQRLVSMEGDLWRWDGFVAAADAPSAAAIRLAERNRLGELEHRESSARSEAENATAASDEATNALTSAQTNERALRDGWREMQNQLAAARQALTIAETTARETETKLSNNADARGRIEEGLGEAREKLDATLKEVDALLPAANLEDEQLQAQEEATEQRTELSQIRANVTALAREKQAREQRRAAIASDVERWSTRNTAADKQIETLKERRVETATELEQLAQLPDQIEARRHALMAELAQAETERKEAADKLATADTAHREIQGVLRGAQAAVATGREQRARIEVRLETSRERRSVQSREIQETLDCAPEGCLALAQVDGDVKLPALSDVERLLAKLRADRERIGGVNMAAEEELEQLVGDFQGMEDERLDLEQAIAKLRGAITSLNKEARERLLQAFEIVNNHFKRLFGTLFDGGEARLELIEGDDPMESGLEIVARPPGKKPATLSLLSGGEQTLTALSLIFAVFLTNPSPICVLDEVDAPLDDANVDRFCAMMERMAADTDTRFLVITHHPMTMARMNRLFGVTMGEKGVSQLVSVDLATAEQIVDAA